MGRISVGEAIAAGFKLIGREPAAFAVWCGVYLLVNLVPQMAVWPAMAEMYGSLASGAGQNDAAVLEAANRATALQPLSLILMLLTLAVLPPAVFRAVLHPEQRRFFYLRLGAREFWVLIVTIVVFVVWILSFLVSMVPALLFAFLGSLLASAGGGGAVVSFLLVFIGYAVAIGATIWIVLRLSMAPILSFADNAFRFPESWRLTKGHAWRLFLVALALFAISVVGQLLIVGVGAAALVAGTPDFFQTLQANPAAIFAGIGLPAILIGTVVLSIFGAGLHVVGAAAWADIYRQLRPPLAETFS